MTCTRPLTAAAAMALAAVVSGCAGTVAGTPTLAAPPPAGSTELKSARVPAAPMPTPAPVDYEDVTNRGVVFMDNGVPSPQSYSPVPAPGVTIVAGDGQMCGLGPAIRSMDGLFVGYVSAGHCNPDVGDRRFSYNSSPDQLLVPLAAMTDALDDGAGIDSGAIWIAQEGGSRLAQTWAVAGVLTAEAVAALPPGPVCLLGAVSGVQCGELIDASDRGRLRFAAESVDGDSGGPVFRVDAVTGHATLLGVLEGGNDFTTTATYLAPALDRLGAVAVVDRSAAVTVAGRPGYSDRVVLTD